MPRGDTEKGVTQDAPSLPPGEAISVSRATRSCLGRHPRTCANLLHIKHCLPSSKFCVCFFPKQQLRCWPHPTKEQSHIVQSKQLQYQLEQIDNHTPRPQSSNPAGQSRVKRFKATGSKTHLYLLSKCAYRVQFLCGLPHPLAVTNILLET